MSKINYTITVNRPVLTEQERERRINEIKSAMVALVIATEERKANKNGREDGR